MAKTRKKKDKAAAGAIKGKKAKKRSKSNVAGIGHAPLLDQGAAATVESAVRAAKDKVVEIATKPIVAEIVAATLLAAAAALRNPEKARQLAHSAGDELEGIAKDAAGKGGAFWQLATDVARRTIAALDEDQPGGGKKGARSGKG